MPIPTSTKSQIAAPRVLLGTTVASTARAFLLPMARHFQQRGWRVDAIANGIEHDRLCRSTFDRVWEATWSRNPAHPRNVTMTERVRSLVVEQGYDIVHVHTPVAAFVMRFALKHLRGERQLQVIYTAHGFHFHPMGGPIRNRCFELLERKAATWTDFLIVMNQEDRRAAKDKAIIRSDRLRFMPGIGVDRSRYSSSSVSEGEVDCFYRERGISAATPLLLMVAEFTSGKRHADAILALSHVSPPAQLILAGSGPLQERMRCLAAQSGVAERVHFLGQRDDIPILMKASRAVLLPSIREGLPRSVLEAMSMGVPVIGSRIRGTTELLAQSAGILVEVGDVDQLALAMQWVVDNPAESMAMGQAGRQQSEAYDIAHILRMHEELYEEALERKRSATYACSPCSAAGM